MEYWLVCVGMGVGDLFISVCMCVCVHVQADTQQYGHSLKGHESFILIRVLCLLQSVVVILKQLEGHLQVLHVLPLLHQLVCLHIQPRINCQGHASLNIAMLRLSQTCFTQQSHISTITASHASLNTAMLH